MSKLLATLLPALLLASVHASLSSDGATVQHSRRLLAPVKKAFPFRKCIAGGGGSPYKLAGPRPTVTNGVLNITLTVVSNPRADTAKSACIKGISNNLNTLDVRVGKACTAPGVVQAVYVNGVIKTSGVSFNKITGLTLAELIITDLGLGTTVPAIGTTITILAGGVCNTPASLSGRRDGKFVYYLSTAANANCCPVNTWDFGKSFGADEPQTPGSLTITTNLDTSVYQASDLMDEATSPLKSTLQVAAANASLTAAGLLDAVTGYAVRADTIGPNTGVDTVYDFAGETQAYLAGDYLIQSFLQAFIRTSQTPCGSVLSIHTANKNLGAFSCKGSQTQYALPDLCVTGTATQACVTPPHGVQEGSNKEESSEESSEGSEESSEHSFRAEESSSEHSKEESSA